MRKLDVPIPFDPAASNGHRPERTDFERLVLLGLSLRAPDELDDEALPAKLWEVVDGLAELGRVLQHTDHLSDRELYEHLWRHVLRERVPDDEPGQIGFQVVDVLGGWGPDDLLTYLRYYVADQERDDFANGLPPEEVPVREEPPYDRDRRIAEMCGFV